MTGTQMRLQAVVRLALSLLFTVAAGVGWQLDTALITQIAMTALALASVIWAWWKNAPITEEAIDAQDYLMLLKDGTIPVGIDRLLVNSQNSHDVADVADAEDMEE